MNISYYAVLISHGVLEIEALHLFWHGDKVQQRPAGLGTEVLGSRVWVLARSYKAQLTELTTTPNTPNLTWVHIPLGSKHGEHSLDCLLVLLLVVHQGRTARDLGFRV